MPTRTPDNLSKWLLFAGALSFIPTLFFYLTGEEGIYVITSMEMWYQQNWLQQLMYGLDNGRPPLVNWLTMPLSALLGWSHVVIAVRLVSVAATLGTVAILYWLSLRLFRDRSFALFSALAALSLADWLLYRGWLSYTDPVFAFFTFGAMACLWLGIIEQRLNLLLLSILMVSAAMLTKAFTAYVFYATVAGVLIVWQPKTRKFVFSVRTMLSFMALAIVPLLWFSTIPQGGNGAGMLDEITRKLSSSQSDRFLNHFFTYPLEVLLHLSPALLLAIYLLLRKRVSQAETVRPDFRVACWITVITFLPYWLSPQSGIRYLLPIYPMVALVSARLIWRAGERARHLALRWFAGVIALKFLFALLLFPYYQTHYRGENYQLAAQHIMARTHNAPLYVTDVRSIGLSITGYIDMARFPQAPLTMPPQEFSSGYLLAMQADPALTLIDTYKIAADEIYLLCKGMACDNSPTVSPQ